MLFRALLVLLPVRLPAQELPFVVTVFDATSQVLKHQRQSYRSEASENEVLSCVEAWKAGDIVEGRRTVLITRVRRAAGGGRHSIADLESHCVGPDNKPLPTIHSHTDGNCQFSPRDLVTFAARRAPFEGVQCGQRHFVWTSSEQIVAMANGLQALRGNVVNTSPR